MFRRLLHLYNPSSSTLQYVKPPLRRLSRPLTYALEGNASEANSTFIHPTAVVHPNAVIGQGTSVGPFCTVGSSAKIGYACQLHAGSHVFGNTELGEHCIIMIGAIVGEDLPGRTVIGCKNLIGHHAVVGVRCQDLKYKAGEECFLDIGENNDIREYCSIHRSSKSSDRTVIGDKNLIMGTCHIAHDCEVGNNSIFANNTLFAGHVVIEIRKMRRAYQKIFMPIVAKSGNIEGRLVDVEHNEELCKSDAVSSMLQSIRDSFGQHRRGICKFRCCNLFDNTTHSFFST